MYFDDDSLIEYPFYGVFSEDYINEDLPIDQQVVEERIVVSTPCDIQETNKKLNGTITDVFAVFFPFDKDSKMYLKRGMKFKGDMYGLDINGIVHSVVPSQMGGCVAYIVDKDV